MSSPGRSALIDEWHNYSQAIVRKGRRLLHDIITSWPLPDKTLIRLVMEALRDYCSLWDTLLKLVDGDKPSTELHLYRDTYPRQPQLISASLRNSLIELCNTGLMALRREPDDTILDMAVLHTRHSVSILHHGSFVDPVLPAMAGLLHDILEGTQHRISVLVVFLQTRRGARSLKAYFKLLVSQWFIDVMQTGGIGSLEIVLPSAIIHGQHASLEPLFRLVTTDFVAHLNYCVDCNRQLTRTLNIVLEYYPYAAQVCLATNQQLTRLQLFSPTFSPSAALSPTPDVFTADILSLVCAYHDVSTGIRAESTCINIYTASCSLSVSAVAQLFRPIFESTYHYYLWKHDEAVPLSAPSPLSPRIDLICVPPLSDQGMTVYFRNLLTNTDGCIYVSCLTGSYVQSLQYMLLSVLPADEFYHIRSDRLYNSVTVKDDLCKYKVIIFSSSSNVLMYMRKYRMFFPPAKGLVLFNGATSEPLLNVLVESLGSSLQHITIFHNDSGIYDTIKKVFQRFYDGMDIVFSRKRISLKKIGHNTESVAEQVAGVGMLSQEVRKKVVMFYGDVEILDTLALAAAVTRFGPGDGLCLADLSREVTYQSPVQRAYGWKPVKISPEEWLLIALCIAETYFSGMITTTALCDSVIEMYCNHLQELSPYQCQLVVRLLCLTMGTQSEHRHLIGSEVSEPHTNVRNTPIIKRCYANFNVSTRMHMRRIVRAIIVKLLVCRVLCPYYAYKMGMDGAQTLLQRYFEESIPLSVELGSLAFLLAEGNSLLHSKLSELGEWNVPLLSSCLQHFCIAGVSKRMDSIAKDE